MTTFISTLNRNYIFHRIFVLAVIILSLSVRAFSQSSVNQSRMMAIHTYDVSKEYNGEKREHQLHATAQVAVIPFWENSWLKISIGLIAVISLGCVQRARTRKIHKMRTDFAIQIDQKNEEISHQAKNIKLQAESNHDLKELSESLKTQLTQQTEKANRAERAKTSFLSMISYGVRTPLNGLMGSATLLMETNLTNEQRELSKTVHSCGENLLTAINDMFDFAKIESGEVKLEQKEFSLRTCVEDVMEVFATKSAESDIDFIYSLDRNIPSQLVGDSFRLKQVLVNLVANTVKFTQQLEDVVIDIRSVASESNQCTLAFSVYNTGVGIHYESAVSMFKSFSKADYSETTQYGGTGLSLANCENLVRLMGGSIAMESLRGKGSSFTFEISLKVSQNPFLKIESFEIESLAGKNVLVVDNHQNNLMLLKAQLEEWRMTATAVNSGFEAMKILSENAEFDLVLTDLKMPGFDGIQLTQAIKKIHPSLPVILISPAANDHWKKDENLIASCISKPVKQLLLYKHIFNALQTSGKIKIEVKSEETEIASDFSYEYPVRILIAEDNVINQKLTQRVLAKLGYKSTIVTNGREAIDILKKDDYDMIFMDVQMPVLNGLEATIQIRQQDQIQPIIIAMTANTMTGDREECLRAGMDDYISKPMNQSEMIHILKKWALQIKVARQKRSLAQA